MIGAATAICVELPTDSKHAPPALAGKHVSTEMYRAPPTATGSTQLMVR